jgi:hypothetical protein
MGPVCGGEPDKEAREYAWNWFDLHSAQRMQTFNFFLVATAFLIAAYASLLEKHRAAAVGVALVGAWVAFWFNRLDCRTRQLVKAGERALVVSETRLAEYANLPHVKILEAVEKPIPGSSSYRRVVSVIQWTIVWVFLVAAAYAVWFAGSDLPPLLL